MVGLLHQGKKMQQLSESRGKQTMMQKGDERYVGEAERKANRIMPGIA